jgi:hypothetical protein
VRDLERIGDASEDPRVGEEMLSKEFTWTGKAIRHALTTTMA